MKKLIIFTGIATAILLALKASARLDRNKENGVIDGKNDMSFAEGGVGVKNGLLSDEISIGGDAGSSARGGFRV